MKLVTAVIQPQALTSVREALSEIGINGATISEAVGSGRQKGHSEVYRGARVPISVVPKVRLEMVIHDDHVEKAIQVIIDSARTGELGDGKIWISPIEDVIRVRTGTRGDDAL